VYTGASPWAMSVYSENLSGEGNMKQIIIEQIEQAVNEIVEAFKKYIQEKGECYGKNGNS
jgi:hypothetical protein